MRKKIIIAALTAITLSFIPLSAVSDTAYAAEANLQTIAANSINVQGKAIVKAAPTMATVNIGVNTFNKDAASAQQENAAKMNSVYSALKQLGFDEKSIRTTAYTISPRYEWITDSKGNGKSELTGYDVRNAVEVTITDLSKVSKVLDVTIKQGVNEASTITYGISEQEQSALYIKALKEAVKQAKAKADAIASVCGIVLGKPSQITENYSVTPPIYYDSIAKSIGNQNASETPISAGDVTIEANVSITYQY